jgi:hypothetical protein
LFVPQTIFSQTEKLDTLSTAEREIEIEGARSFAILTVYSGYGKTTSILAVFNNDTYLRPISAFVGA